jgi:hypothetical protein
MNNTEWLESLKVGDEVAIDLPHHGYSIEKITNVTKTQICTKFSRYRKKDGRSIGSADWFARNIEPVTDRIRNMVARSSLAIKLKKQSFSALTLDQLQRIQEIINEVEK